MSFSNVLSWTSGSCDDDLGKCWLNEKRVGEFNESECRQRVNATESRNTVNGCQRLLYSSGQIV